MSQRDKSATVLPSGGLRLAGNIVHRERTFAVCYPYTGETIAHVSKATTDDVQLAFKVAATFKSPLTRHQRYTVLMRARTKLTSEISTWAHRITLESGLCLKDTWHEVGRACDVLLLAANQSLIDDGQVFSCDITERGQERKAYTTRDPLLGAISAITPFNHPLNQVVHKVAPAIATNNRIVLKPSEKTPLSALAFADLMYESGLPPEMFQVLTGSPTEIGDALVTDPYIDLVTFTGSSQVGREIATKVGYKRIILELGGNDPLIVLEDADVIMAAKIAAQGAFRNSGQRCTAVKRILVHNSIADEFALALLSETRTLRSGDPFDPMIDVGTVIDAGAAASLHGLVENAIASGAVLLYGGDRQDSLLKPTVLDNVLPRMQVVTQEAFGPIAPLIRFQDVSEAITFVNESRYGLSAGVCTKRLDYAMRFIKELHVGTVNINEAPGYRMESTPFGGIKDSGLGYKEGVIETMKAYTNLKTYSIPW